MYRRMRNCCCHNNIMPYDCNSKKIEDSCDYVQDCNLKCMDECECGFDEERQFFPENPVLAQSYVPIQKMDKTYVPCVGLKMGTIFPELVSPYMPGQSQSEAEYIRATNSIGEGCNKC